MDLKKEIEKLRLKADIHARVGDGTGWNETMEQIAKLTRQIQETKNKGD